MAALYLINLIFQPLGSMQSTHGPVRIPLFQHIVASINTQKSKQQTYIVLEKLASFIPHKIVSVYARKQYNTYMTL